MTVTKISLAVLTAVASTLLLVLGKNVDAKKLVVLEKPFFFSNVPKKEEIKSINVIGATETITSVSHSKAVNQTSENVEGTFTCRSQKGCNHAEDEPTLTTLHRIPSTASPMETSSYFSALSALRQCSLSMEYNTDTTYNFHYLELPVGISHIKFEAKATNNVHIALSPSENSYDLYEIVIGGWKNTRSVIRRCEQCTNLADEATDLYLSADEFRWFWVTFESNGTIAVGRNDELTPFMKWTDPDPLEVQYLGYSTGWGTIGQFRFCGLG